MTRAIAELASFIQRRELLAYEQRMARSAYAYGVDLRRSQWLEESSLGEPLIRSVDRRWSGLAAELSKDTVLGPDARPPARLMEDVMATAHLIRAPLPAVRLLRPGVASTQGWPWLAPLGTTRGTVQWLVVDLDVMSLPAAHRAFLLASALGHLQCDHGPLFSAHLMAHRAGRGRSLVRTIFSPWSRVAVFSADRAGLLAAGSLDPALQAMRAAAERPFSWSPVFPNQEVRERALVDFDQSLVVSRLREAASTDRHKPSAAAASDSTTAEASTFVDATAADASGARPWSLARCDERLTRRLGLL